MGRSRARRSLGHIAAGLSLILVVGCAEEVATTSSSPNATDLEGGVDTAPVVDVSVAAQPDVSATSTTPSTPAETEADEDTAWALGYTGGSAGVAEGEPYKIGYVNAEVYFPESTVGLNAAVAFANAELGGIGGRPIEIVECAVAPGDDGAVCGTQMANDPGVDVVVTGALPDAHQALFDALEGSKPVLIGNGLTLEDFTTTAGVSYSAGSPSVVPALGFTATDLLPSTPTAVAVIHEDSAAGALAVQLLLQPVLEAGGATVTSIPIPTTATATEVQSAMLAAGVEAADVFIPVVAIQQCINVADSIEALGIAPTVVTTGLCVGAPMREYLDSVGVEGETPDGWYLVGNGYNEFAPDRESGSLTYVNKMLEYGEPAPGATSIEISGFAGASFANVMTLMKLINQVGLAAAEPAGIDAAMRAYAGPAMLQVGPLDCGAVSILDLDFPAVCASQAGVQQFEDGEWISIADGLNGEPIDVLAISVG
jgi:branched-chain amino acid transport system substrate-binding protein